MSGAKASIFKRLNHSPSHIHNVLRNFSANAGSFDLTKEQALEKYNNKWIAIYNGSVAAVADDLTQLALEVAAKHIPASETLFRHIDPKDKVFIL